jgi:hypothetical protein
MADLEYLLQARVHLNEAERSLLAERGITVEEVAVGGVEKGRETCMTDRNVHNFYPDSCQLEGIALEDGETIELRCVKSNCPRENRGGYNFNPVRATAVGIDTRLKKLVRKKAELVQAESEFRTS